MLEIDNHHLGHKRELRTSKDEMYMLAALAAASCSADPSTQVGACYVGENGQILATGCNCAPFGWNEDEFPWNTDPQYGPQNVKYTFIDHAERASLHGCSASFKDFKNATLYVTLFPCKECAMSLINLGVKKVVYLNYRECPEFDLTKILLKRCGIEYVDFKTISNLDSLELDIHADEKHNIMIKK